MKRLKLTDLKPLKANPNKGSQRGDHMLATSLEQGGVGRSIVIAANGDILAGNHVTEQYAEKFEGGEIIVVETDGTQLVAVQRTDLPNAQDPRAKALIIGDNRSSDFIEYDMQVLNDLIQSDKALMEGFWYEHELDQLIHHLSDEPFDHEREWRDMPEFEQSKVDVFCALTVYFHNEIDLQKFAVLMEQTITPSTKSIHYPKREKMDIKKLRIVDES